MNHETLSSMDAMVPLMKEALSLGRSVRFSPKGISMLPMLRQGRDSVVLSPAPERLRKYDIPLYIRENGQYVLHRIIQAKGLSKAAALLSDIMMPTPSAVLQAMELLSQGCEGESGIGDLVAVDVGGATTDVYSMADGMPESMNTVYKGIPEPYSKRTVEGDIGMRYSIAGILDAAGEGKIASLSGLAPSRGRELVADLQENTDKVPDGDPELERLDYALASCAVEEAVRRHAGRLSETYTMMGLTYVQTGKNHGVFLRGESGNVCKFLHKQSEEELRRQGYKPREYYEKDEELHQVLTQIGSGVFSPEDPGRYRDLVDSLINFGDHYQVLADYRSYVDCQDKVDELYELQEEWTAKAMLNIANMGYFSSDRTIKEYADHIWHIDPVRL